jgi:hypothetical protein
MGMKLKLTPLNVVLAVLYIVAFFTQNYLFSQYLTSSKKVADTIYNVKLNNHGSIVYVTAQQGQALDLSISVALFFLGLWFCTMFYQARKLRKARLLAQQSMTAEQKVMDDFWQK